MHYDKTKKVLDPDTFSHVKYFLLQKVNFDICLCIRHMLCLVCRSCLSYDEFHAIEKILEHMIRFSKKMHLQLSIHCCTIMNHIHAALEYTYRNMYMNRFIYWQKIQSIRSLEQTRISEHETCIL